MKRGIGNRKIILLLIVLILIILVIVIGIYFKLTGYQVYNECHGDCLVSFSGKRFGIINFGNSKTALEINNSLYFQAIYMLNETGIKFVRWNVNWEDLEPNGDGVYNFDWLKKNMTLLKNDGTEILVMITTRNCHNCVNCGTNPCTNPSSVYQMESRAGFAPADYTKHYNFIYNFANYFSDSVSMIQIDNEVNPGGIFWQGTLEDYKKVMNNSYLAVKDAEPNMPVVLAGFSSPQWIITGSPANANDMAIDVLENTNYDIVDIHFYHNYTTIDDKISWFKNRGIVNLISTEMSGPDPSDNSTSGMANQSKEMIKRFSIGFSNGLKKINWFSFYDLTGEGDSRFWHMGLENRTGLKKPVYYTYKILIDKIGNFSSVESISDSIYKYSVNGKNIIIAWNDSGNSVINLSSYFSALQVNISHIVSELDSNDMPIYFADEVAACDSVAIGETPIFIEKSSFDYDADNDGYNPILYGGNDCNDTNNLEFPGQTWYFDGDDDGYYNGTNLTGCSRLENYKLSSEIINISLVDCNDSSSLAYTGAAEICGDGVDNDCANGDASCSPQVQNPSTSSSPGATSVCSSVWNCTSWTSCENNIQFRDCYDIRDCSHPSSFPSLNQSCGIPQVIRNETGLECKPYSCDFKNKKYCNENGIWTDENYCDNCKSEDDRCNSKDNLKYLKFVIFGFGFVLVIGAVVFFVIHREKDTKLKNYYLLLRPYISLAYRRGETREQIRRELIERKWPEKIVDKVLNESK